MTGFPLEIRADREKVVMLVEALRAAYEKFINDNAPIGYLDGFMAAHNFHKLVIQDIEARNGLNEGSRLELRKAAVETFRMALTGTPEEQEAIRARNES